MLAKWLLQRGDKEEIVLRQQSVAELNTLVEWRQKLLAVGYALNGSLDDPERILGWVKENPHFLPKKGLWIFSNILSVITLISCVLLPIGAIVLIFVFNGLVYFTLSSKISTIHAQVSKTSEMLKSYSQTIEIIESKVFTSKMLLKLQSSFLKENRNASARIKEFSGLVNRLDFRLNVLVEFVLNLFFFWDIRQIRQMEKWKVENQFLLTEWFESMAQFEALSSLANIGYNNPEWVFPKVCDGAFCFESQALGHPLIPTDRRICNDFTMQGSAKVVLVTGSNMSGKSTFQRTIGINMVLAMAGSVVCASSMTVSCVTPFTSMRISDSLEDNTSSFYAELKRLAAIIQSVEKGECVFLLLDEILRGTNSGDRHIGSVALIRQLIRNNAVGVIATHDLALSEITSEFPDNIENYHFDVKIEGEELYFDYKMNRGICQSLNASILMKKMGIQV